MGDFDGRGGAALVVGGSGGLGSVIARMLAERGATVATTYRTTRPEGSAYALDLTSPEQAAGVREQAAGFLQAKSGKNLAAASDAPGRIS